MCGKNARRNDSSPAADGAIGRLFACVTEYVCHVVFGFNFGFSFCSASILLWRTETRFRECPYIVASLAACQHVGIERVSVKSRLCGM